MANVRAYVSEFVGTFLFCVAAIGAVLSATPSVGGGGGLVAMALAPGFALAAGVATFGGVSGGHFNPAVTLGMATTGRIGAAAAVVYVAVQLLGAVAAALVCYILFPANALQQGLVGLPLPAPWLTPVGLVIGEFVATFLLTMAVYGALVDDRGRSAKIGALAIGLVFAANVLALGAVTGASMNPARSFGPALVSGVWTLHIYYWIAPIAGAIAAAQLYERVLLPQFTNS